MYFLHVLKSELQIVTFVSHGFYDDGVLVTYLNK